MSVGGRIIEIRPFTQTDVDDPKWRREVIRIWVVARNGDEAIVYAEPASVLPKLGDDIWWQSKKIFFNYNNNFLKKIGYSHTP